MPAVALLYLPLRHSSQAASPSFEYFPGLQLSQDVASLAGYVPAAQSVHWPALMPLYLPLGHA
jgi:hypothetical protein